jgi:hypothetical protein
LTGDVSGTSFSANGMPANMVSFYLDGAYNNVYKNGAGGNAVPNPDALGVRPNSASKLLVIIDAVPTGCFSYY